MVGMQTTKQVILDKTKLIVTFPFDRAVIDTVKTIDGRKWNDINKYWTLPFSPWHCSEAIRVLSPLGFNIDEKIVQHSRTSKAIELHAPTVDYPAGMYDFQREGVDFIRQANGRVILADSMGLGKTITSLAFRKMFCQKTLVVCPASVVLKWAAEHEKWCPDLTYQVILKGKDDISQNADTVIMSYAICVRKYEWIKDDYFDAIMLDEAHAIKSFKSQRSRVVRSLVRSGIGKVLCISGTPFLNDPSELYPLLNLLDPNGYSNFYSFAQRYMGAVRMEGMWVIPKDKVTNLEELQQRVSSIMLRRTAKDVALQLPDLTRVPVPVVLENMSAYKQAVRDVRQWLKERDRTVMNPAHALTRLNVLRQVVGEGKVDAAVELAESVLQDGRKVVLFVHHKAVVLKLIEALRKYGVRLITGDVGQEERQRNVNEFLSLLSSTRVMIISVAGAEGIDLFSASDIIFVEREWTPAKEEQAEARLHRIGQKNAVRAWYLIAKNTVDEKLDGIVRTKRKLFGQVIKTDEVIEELLKELEEA